MAHRFKIGELVAALYDFGDYYVFWEDEEYSSSLHHGIIVELRWPGHLFGWGPAYAVLCTDGRTRIFYETEITLL